MKQTSVINKIFEKYFETFKDKLDNEIIENLKEVFESDYLTEANLNDFIKWLENYNAEDKKP
ncbi:MAG: hypothetical protein H8D22_03330 [Candidatus Cloacimonetes bacterium]|nr:hypothetical protein [Candidatus Cloacimonadota bacterium]